VLLGDPLTMLAFDMGFGTRLAVAKCGMEQLAFARDGSHGKAGIPAATRTGPSTDKDVPVRRFFAMEMIDLCGRM
jgi:hypothetical protein